MTRIRTTLGLLLPLAVALPVSADDLQDSFNQGVELLKKGDREGALAQFRAALAADPSSEEAYELWRSTEHQVWLDMLVEGGEFELIARRMMEKVRISEAELSTDEDAIAELVDVLRGSSDVVARRAAVRELAAKHGEYAVPKMLGMLRAEDGSDTSVIGMVSLAEMGSPVVLPLIEALHADSEFLQANVAHTLGRIGDRRAAGALSDLAASASGMVAQAASAAAEKCGAAGRTPVELFIEEGRGYYTSDDTYVRPYDPSEVMWHWQDGRLVYTALPGAIHSESLAKRAFTRALSADPQSIDALAGLARSASSIETKLAALEDVDAGLLESSAQGNLAVAMAGATALEAALGNALDQQPMDVIAGVALCRNLAHQATSATTNLTRASQQGDGSLRAEAAIALAHIAAQSGSSPGDDIVGSLADAAAREVMRVVVIIDGDLERMGGMQSTLDAAGASVIAQDRAAAGLAMLRQLPGVDAVMVGDGLSDLTLDQVVTEIASMDHISKAALFIVSSSDANEAYGDRDRVAGVIDGSDLSDVQAIFDEDLTGDRAEADDLSRRSSEALAAVAARGGDITAAVDALANVAQNREADAVAIPAMHALGLGGGAGQVYALVAVLADTNRSDAARIAAADAMNGIFGREAVAVSDAAGLREVVVGDGPLAVRQAAARALGRAEVADDERATIVDEVAAGGSQ